MNTALITGVGSGIGREVALDLTRRGWHLALPVRSPDRAEEIRRYAHAVGAPDPLVLVCDLAEPTQVRRMCDMARSGLESFDLIINVAGIGSGSDPALREQNQLGVELRMAVNAVAPHLIVRELAGSLSATGRVIHVGSMGQAALDLDDLNFERRYEGIEAYCRSKLALVMSAQDLATRGVPINVVHPANEMPTAMVTEAGFPIASTLDDGTLPVLRLALDSKVAGVTGQYFDRFDRAEPHPQADDPDARRRVVDWLEAAASAHLAPSAT